MAICRLIAVLLACTLLAQQPVIVDFQIMPYDQGRPQPGWYRNSGARRANKPTDKDGEIWSPDGDDPLYLKHWVAMVVAAGARYDGLDCRGDLGGRGNGMMHMLDLHP